MHLTWSARRVLARGMHALHARSFTSLIRRLDIHHASAVDVAEAQRVQTVALRSDDLDIYAIPAALRGSLLPSPLHSRIIVVNPCRLFIFCTDLRSPTRAESRASTASPSGRASKSPIRCASDEPRPVSVPPLPRSPSHLASKAAVPDDKSR
jgi:hypothetical protein